MKKNIKLFKVSNKDSFYFCFACNEKTAKQIVSTNCFAGKRTILKAEDVTAVHLSEDGVSNLINNEFIGIPKRTVFMLNGSMSAMQDHYDNKRRSETLWWSEKIPGSKEIWK